MSDCGYQASPEKKCGDAQPPLGGSEEATEMKRLQTTEMVACVSKEATTLDAERQPLEHVNGGAESKEGVICSSTKNLVLQPINTHGQIQRCPKPIVSYEAFMWVSFLAITTFAVVDRFTTNLWPRQFFSIGSGSAGSDLIVGFIPGPWSIVVYDVIARVTGRYSICCFNLLLITRLKFLEHAIIRSTWVNQILDCSNIMKSNTRLHRWNAIALCILTVVHVWSILLPCVTHGYSVQVIVGFFEWPLSERAPSGFKDANAEAKMMSLEVDDVYRMVLMTVLLCFLMPLSIKWLTTHWHIGMPLHRLISTLYFVDIVRRHTHPHSWLLNTPVFLAWVADKIWSWYCNRVMSPKMHRVYLGEGYMVVYWNHKGLSNISSIVSPDYFLRLKDSSFLESPHIFTSFQNHEQSTILKDGKPFEWTVGLVIQVYRDARKPKLGTKDHISHTARMYDLDAHEFDVTAWGPYNSETSTLLRASLIQITCAPTICIGAGSGIGYIIDVLQWRRLHSPEKSLKILFSTRNLDLFRWVKDTVEKIVADDDMIQIKLAFTGKHHTKADANLEEGCLSNVSIHYCHFDFDQEIEERSIVFSQGSKALNEYIGKICYPKKAKFYGGLQATEPIYIFDALIDSMHRSMRRSMHAMNTAVNNVQRSFHGSTRATRDDGNTSD